MMWTKLESGITFGPYNEADVFAIEDSKLYKSVGEGIKITEFVVIRDGSALCFIEAKSSTPNVQNKTGTNQKNINEFLKDIADKFINSFNLYFAAILKRTDSKNEISSNFFELDNSKIKIKFILVIQNHKLYWLPPLKEAIAKEIYLHTKLWNIDLLVLNEDLAKEFIQ